MGPGKEAFSGTLFPLFCVSVISYLTFLHEFKGESFVLSSIYFQVSHIKLSGITSFSLVSKSLWDESEVFSEEELLLKHLIRMSEQKPACSFPIVS